MTVSEEQHAAFLERYKKARVAAGLSPLIDDEKTLRMIAAVVASAIERKRRDAQPPRRGTGAEQGGPTDAIEQNRDRS